MPIFLASHHPSVHPVATLLHNRLSCFFLLCHLHLHNTTHHLNHRLSLNHHLNLFRILILILIRNPRPSMLVQEGEIHNLLSFVRHACVHKIPWQPFVLRERIGRTPRVLAQQDFGRQLVFGHDCVHRHAGTAVVVAPNVQTDGSVVVVVRRVSSCGVGAGAGAGVGRCVCTWILVGLLAACGVLALWECSLGVAS